MRRFTFLPWDIYSWKTALAWSGTSGLAMLALLLAEFVQVQDPNAATMHSSTVTIWLIRAPLTFVAAMLLLSQPVFPKLAIRDLRLWFLMYAVYYAFSTLWSTSPLITAGKAFELIVAILIILQASRDKYALRRLEGIYRLTLLLTSFLALITLLGYFAGIEVFVNRRLGIFTQTTAESPFYSGNGLGYLSVSFVLLVFAEFTLGGLKISKALPQLSYALFIFLFSGSRTAFAILALGVVIVLLRRSKAALIAFLLCACSAGYFFGPRLIKRLNGSQSAGSLDTLSGRTVMWAAAWRQWQKHPLLGYGGGAGGKFVLSHMGASSGAAKMSHLHNGFLECLTGLGIFGFLLACSILVVATFRVVGQWKKYPSFAGLYIWIVTIWITCIMSSGVLSYMGVMVVFYLVILAHGDILRRGDPGAGYAPRSWELARQIE
jgi:O-antigen ligase